MVPGRSRTGVQGKGHATTSVLQRACMTFLFWLQAEHAPRERLNSLVTSNADVAFRTCVEFTCPPVGLRTLLAMQLSQKSFD